MEDYESVRDNLQAAALKVKYILLMLGVMPVFLFILEIILAFAIQTESLQSLRSFPNKALILIVLALVSILSVTFEPWFMYRMILKGLEGKQANFSGIIIIKPCIATTPAVTGVVLLFFYNIYVSLPFLLLSLIYVWNFNFKIESFMDRTAKDIFDLHHGADSRGC
jgi:hypothetical protein